MLENQCRRWDSPIAAVVYMPLAGGKLITMDDVARDLNGTDVAEGIRLVHEFHARMEAEGAPPRRGRGDDGEERMCFCTVTPPARTSDLGRVPVALLRS